MWHPQWILNNGIWVDMSVPIPAKPVDGPYKQPTPEEIRSEQMRRFVEGKRAITPDRHADGCECWRCKPEEWK